MEAFGTVIFSCSPTLRRLTLRVFAPAAEALHQPEYLGTALSIFPVEILSRVVSCRIHQKPYYNLDVVGTCRRTDFHLDNFSQFTTSQLPIRGAYTRINCRGLSALYWARAAGAGSHWHARAGGSVTHTGPCGVPPEILRGMRREPR